MSLFKIEYLKDATKLVNDNGTYKCFAYEDGQVDPHKGKPVNLGFKLQVTKEYFVNVFSTIYKSLGGVGDSDYRGVYTVIIFNNTDTTIKYKKGDHIANVNILKTFTPEIEEQ